MENNNGRGIFYGVIGVATLVVAIIGATFAYFSAQVSATNIAANTANISLGYTDVIDGRRFNLIPIDTDAANTANGQGSAGADTVDNSALFPTVIGIEAKTEDDNGLVTGGSCLDVNKNEICSTLKFTITNNSPSATYVYGFLQQGTAETTISDLYYAMYVGTPTESNTFGNVWGAAAGADTYLTANNTKTAYTGFGLIQSATKVNAEAVVENSTNYTGGMAVGADNWNEVKNAKIWLEPGQSVDYWIVLWVEESYVEQPYKNMSFTGSVRFTTGTGSGVTGQLSAAG